MSLFKHNNIRTYRQDKRSCFRSAVEGEAGVDKIQSKRPTQQFLNGYL